VTGASATLRRVDRRVRLAAELAGMAVAIVLAGALLLAIGGADPYESYSQLIDGAFGSSRALGETLIRFAPLAIIAIGLTPSLRAGLFNIGAPGQIAAGALAATMVGLHLDALPTALLLVVAATCAAVAGAAWGLIPALLKARLNVNEILSTLVFNFLAFGLLSYLLTGPLQPETANIAQSDPLPDQAQLPLLLSDTRAHIGVLVALVAVAALAYYQATPAGYRLNLYSHSPSLARQSGASPAKLIVVTMCLGAAAAGLAGWMQVAGVDHRLYATVAAPIGYTALFVALLGGLRPLGILVVSFFFAALLSGGDSLQVGAGVSPEIIDALIGLLLLAAAVHMAFRIRGRPAA
jgi:general nucleoside transport system permease protein